VADESSSPPALERPFRLIAADGRVLAQNPAGKLIDIGEIVHEPQRGYTICLDVGGLATPDPQPDAERALAALQPSLTFDYLDGLFTSMADAHVEGLLDACPQRRFTLDEPVPRELGAGGQPHRF
jgi:hypothetical protein